MFEAVLKFKMIENLFLWFSYMTTDLMYKLLGFVTIK